MRYLARADQRGTTLVELLVAVPLAALIVAGVGQMLYQMLDTHTYVSDSVECYQQAQRAGSWFSRDAVQAQQVVDNNYSDDGTVAISAPQDGDISGTEVFIAQWTDWNDDVRTAVYSLVPGPGSLYTLQRTVMVNGSTVDTSAVAEHVDASTDPDTLVPRTRFEWVSTEKQVVRMSVTAEYGQESVTRLYEVRPRALVQT